MHPNRGETKDVNNASNEDTYFNMMEEETEIDVESLYSALFKLSSIFELNESMPKKLVMEVCYAPCSTSKSQYRSVKNWARAYAHVSLTNNEAKNLIKYVKLYEPDPPSDGNGHNAEYQQEVSSKGNDVKFQPDHDYNFDCSHLVCPFLCDMSAWKAEIHRQILSRTVPLYADTIRSDLTTPSVCIAKGSYKKSKNSTRS